MKCAFQTTLRVIEVGLIDRRASESVFNMHVDVVLAQTQFGFLPVGIDGNDGSTGIITRRHQRSRGRNHQVASPAKML